MAAQAEVLGTSVCQEGQSPLVRVWLLGGKAVAFFGSDVWKLSKRVPMKHGARTHKVD